MSLPIELQLPGPQIQLCGDNERFVPVVRLKLFDDV